MVRKSQGLKIILQNASPELRTRLRLESLKQGRSTSEIAFEILDRNLPQYKEFTAVDNENNGHTETLRQQFEKAGQS